MEIMRYPTYRKGRIRCFYQGRLSYAYVPQVSVTAQEPAMVQMVILERDVEPPYVVDTYPANGSRRVPIINGFVDIWCSSASGWMVAV